MGGLGGLLAMPFGWLMKGCYLLVKNYGIALLIFTIITRLITFPLTLKQQKSTARLSQIQPELEKIKQKYGKNQEKLNEETMKLYSENNVNPAASCLPALIPIILLYAMIPVVYKPMTYITGADKDHISSDSTFMQSMYTISTEVDVEEQNIYELLKGTDDKTERMKKLEEHIKSDETKYKNSVKLLGTLSADDKDRVLGALADPENNGLDLFMSNPSYFTPNIMNNHYGPEVLFFNFHTKEDGKYLRLLHDDVQAEVRDFNYTAFGLDLGKIPSTEDATMAIPIMSFVLQIITTVISQIMQKRNNPQMKMQGSMFGMMLMMSLLSLYIGFKFPCALGIYWIYSSLFAVAQTIFINIVYTPEKIKEIAAQEAEKAKERKKKKGPSMFERALEVQNAQKGQGTKKVALSKDNDDDDDDDDDDGDRKLSKAQQKEANRQKLNEARRRYAEKYGDEYHED